MNKKKRGSSRCKISHQVHSSLSKFCSYIPHRFNRSGKWAFPADRFNHESIYLLPDARRREKKATKLQTQLLGKMLYSAGDVAVSKSYAICCRHPHTNETDHHQLKLNRHTRAHNLPRTTHKKNIKKN